MTQFIKISFIVECLFLSRGQAYTTNFCNLTCGVEHTVCVTAPCNLKPWCGEDAEMAPLDETDRQIFIEKHNEYRIKLAQGRTSGLLHKKTVSNMHELSYDTELEFVAQCWANSCRVYSDKCRDTSRFLSVGQNTKLSLEQVSTDAETLISEVLEDWAKGVAATETHEFIDFAYGIDTKNFFQISWATTRFLGCGRVYLNPGVVLVCNYAPSGNIPHQAAFVFGKPCSACPENFTCEENVGLCNSHDEFEDFHAPFTMKSCNFYPIRELLLVIIFKVQLQLFFVTSTLFF